MPELPDVVNYCKALNRVIAGHVLERIELLSPFLLRSVEPKLIKFHGKRLRVATREAKQIVLEFDDGSRLLIHLMIAGRLRWRATGRKVPKTNLQALFHFEHGTLLFTEAGKKKRARLYTLDSSPGALNDFRKGGLEVLQSDLEAFSERLLSRNHTLRRALTDQALFSGIGNAYSDEICFRAKLSPIKQTQKMTANEVSDLYQACGSVLSEWVEKLEAEVGLEFPEKVTAFHPDMMVHGRYNEPCRVCGSAIQRIRYADNETNYCPQCQNEGRLLADRSLSRLLKSDWPRTAEELEFHLLERRNY